MLVHIILTALLGVMIIIGFIKIHNEDVLMKVPPINCHIIEYYGKDKKTMVKDYTQAYYVSVVHDGHIYYCIKLRERLSHNQSELLVHFKDNKQLAYKEYKSYNSKEEILGMLHNFKSRTLLTEIVVCWIICLLATNIYCKHNPNIENIEYDLAVLNESLSLKLKDVSEGNPTPAIVMFNIAYETIGLWEVREPVNIKDYQINYIIADARDAFITGDYTNRKIPETGLILRDYLYNSVHKFMIEQSIILHGAFVGEDQDDSIDELNKRYTPVLYCVYMYHALGYAIIIFSIFYIIYKLAMCYLYNHTLKKYQASLGI